MGPAVEDVDAVLAVDRDRSDVGELPSVRQLCEVFNDAVAVLAGAENGWHGCSPLIGVGDAIVSTLSLRAQRSNPDCVRGNTLDCFAALATTTRLKLRPPHAPKSPPRAP